MAVGDGSVVIFLPVLEENDSFEEEMAGGHQEINIVKISATAEAVREIMFWMDARLHFAAMRAEKSETPRSVEFRAGRFAPHFTQDEVHRQVVAKRTQQAGIDQDAHLRHAIATR